MYIICTGEMLHFEEKEMDKARKWIFDTIYSFKDREFKLQNITYDVTEKSIIKKSDSATCHCMQEKILPPSNSSSTIEYCACLKHIVL